MSSRDVAASPAGPSRASHAAEQQADHYVGYRYTQPHICGQWGQEEEQRVVMLGLPVEKTHSESHERHGEINDCFAGVGDGQVTNRQVQPPGTQDFLLEHLLRLGHGETGGGTPCSDLSNEKKTTG
ncbi:hypothetical protein MRX96_046585 [Rhipicephalus microplus]